MMAWAWVLIALAGCGPSEKPAAPTLTVFAAASTTDVITDAAKAFEQQTGTKVVCSFDSSSMLAKQIKGGAKVDVFISADVKWMDDVAAAGSINTATRHDLLGNSLVLIAPKGKAFEVTMSKDFDFAAKLPQISRIAVGDPAHVPAGRYAQAALEYLGWWESLKDKLMPAADVRGALKLVELGEADAGIVYSTDAMASNKVEVVAAFPADSHPPVVYPIAATKDAGAQAAEFIKFLETPAMVGMFEKHGFVVLTQPPR